MSELPRPITGDDLICMMRDRKIGMIYTGDPHFSLFEVLDGIAAQLNAMVGVPPLGDTSRLRDSLGSLELSIRARRTLEALGCSTLRDVVQRTESELRGMPNFGATSLQEIKNKLGERGLWLGMKLSESEIVP